MVEAVEPEVEAVVARDAEPDMEVHISPTRISRHGPTGLPVVGYLEAMDGGVTLVLAGSD